ncbi:MAG TPA: bifunctional methylenetetrahydrofolate dehydrogenase/methenyltetrahydrofolate cyclohydrolase FolD [Spirochaetota bacterium]|nr:bifunctional methylenetetrahydrofolate dehydrogenase/methenyltetrahydrofolate cyclohydrolase FolD [Spirochaetota bacterium]HQO04019.1 bifunctional methylenetetrahydrofolate dehydrogenase/methenyltetrahydrofolate cyclohydrolase FolD [Spirochaetota bacterium]HQP48280.1 bifunctional methylenetetrahydrofolate dehydrogenase/methenyltetrahydrofolate cyclohydrolase FolD [Spirochaetota bacterium]
MAEIIDGKKIAAELREEIRKEVAALKEKTHIAPGLAVVLVGEDPASQVYVRMKGKGCEEAGIASFQHILDPMTTENELLALIDTLNNTKDVNGILVQLPLPRHINEERVLNAIDPGKDVDGFHPVNVGKMVVGDENCFYPCTPYGCQILISRYVKDLKGKHLVIVGRSNIVGKPLANMMVQKNDRANCVVTVCHTAAPDIGYFTKQGDILVVAAGRQNVVTADMVKPGAVVIDVGVNRIPHPDDPSKTKLVGDVDFEGVSKVASAITPVPGGVGPMTITMLLQNTLKAFKIQNSLM